MTLPTHLFSLFGLLALLALPVTTSVAAELAPDQTGIELALYFAPEPKADPEATLDALLKEEFRALDQLATVRRKWTDIERYPPPTPEAFRYTTIGLSREQGAAIAESKRVFVMGFEAKNSDLLRVNREANTLLARLAEATAGLPWDEECRLLYSREAWREKRVNGWQGDIPDVRGHVNMHAYRNPELVRIITLGMRKFGLPDLVLSDVASSTTRAAGNLVNACAQRLLEGQQAEEGRFDLILAGIKHDEMRKSALENPLSGATGRIRLGLLATPTEEGDPANTLWALEFPDATGTSRTERQAAALATLFGAEDKITNVRADDPEMLAASEKARKAFFAAVAAYRKGLQPNERVLVKSGFKIGDQTEYMWVDITRWNLDSVDGILVNDSHFDEKLREGRRVTVAFKDIYDYIHTKPDGTSEGNETGKVLTRRNAE